MPRKPAAAIPRSETTAELIARISAERNAPVASGPGTAGRRGVGLLEAPARSRRPVRVPERQAPLPRERPLRNAAPERTFDDDILTDPEPDDTPTVMFEMVAPLAPRRHALTHRLLPLALGAAAMLAIYMVTATGFTLPDFTDPGPRAVTSESVAPGGEAIPEPGPTGPTVPAPAGGPLDLAPAAVPPANAPPVDSAPAIPAPAIPAPAVPAPAGAAPEDVVSGPTVPAPAGGASVPTPGY